EQKVWEVKSRDIKDQMQRLQKLARKATGAEKERLTAELEALEDRLPDPLPTIPATWNDFGHRTEVHVQKRGHWKRKGEAVCSRPVRVRLPDDLPERPSQPPARLPGPARCQPAPAPPLTPRALLNRLWQHHFGAGLVKTVNDFGTRGDLPSHPELLDWLA